MTRIAILTAGGDTPALNATIYGAVEQANRLKIQVLGLQRGYAGVLDPRVPHVDLNPLLTTIPELSPCMGGTLLGSSRTYIDADSTDYLAIAKDNLARLKVDGLLCIGGDGTVNGMQPFSEFLPCVLAPKTIDNDLGLNYIDEANEWIQLPNPAGGEPIAERQPGRSRIALEDIINYATPGYATAVYVVAQCVERVRTTAESHRRIAIVEVMGRQSGYIALGAAYGQPDLILIPEIPICLDQVERRVRELYQIQQHVVIVVGEGARLQDGTELGATRKTHDPAGNIMYDGAADALAHELSHRLGDAMFAEMRSFEPASSAIFTRKVGHTQRGGRPILFDRFCASQVGAKAMELLHAGGSNQVATMQYSPRTGFTVDAIAANKLRDQWGEIHPRQVHPSLFDKERLHLSEFGMDYLMPIFTNAVGADDMQAMRDGTFHPGNLSCRYQSVNIDIRKRLRYL